MKHYHLILFSILCLFSSFSTSNAEQLPTPLVAPVTYLGPDDIELTVLLLANSDAAKTGNGEALVQLENHPAFGSREIFLTELVNSGSETQFYAKLRNPKWLIARRIQTSYGNSYFLVPQINSKGTLRFTTPKVKVSQSDKRKVANALIRDYFLLNPATAQPPANASVAAAKSINEHCNSKINVEIDNSNFPKPFLREYNRDAICAAALSGISEICSDKLGREALKRKAVSKILCSYGHTPSITIVDKVMNITIAPVSGEYSHRVKNYLNEVL